MLNFICKYCQSKRKNKLSLSAHERACPQNLNRNYKNGMLGKKGSNQFTYAEKHGLEKPKAVISRGMLGKSMSNEAKAKISSKQKENHKNGISYNRGRWKYYKQNPEKYCKFYLAIFKNELTSFIKVGITEKSFDERYSSSTYKNYDKSLLLELSLNGLDALILERNILDKYKFENRVDVKSIDPNFIGHTECLTVDILSQIVYNDLKIYSGDDLISKIKVAGFESLIDHHL